MKKILNFIFILIPISLFGDQQIVIEKVDSFYHYEIEYTINPYAPTIVSFTCEGQLVDLHVHNENISSPFKFIFHTSPHYHNKQLILSYKSIINSNIEIKRVEKFIYNDYDVERNQDAHIESITIANDTPVIIFHTTIDQRYYLLSSTDYKKWNIILKVDGNDDIVFYYVPVGDDYVFYKLKTVKLRYLNKYGRKN